MRTSLVWAATLDHVNVQGLQRAAPQWLGHSVELAPPPCQLQHLGELGRAVQESWPWCRRAGRPASSATTQAQAQGSVLAHPKSYPICELLGTTDGACPADPELQDISVAEARDLESDR